MNKNEFLQASAEIYAGLQKNQVHLPQEDVDLKVLEAPLIGFASADDPLWEQYRDVKAIGPDWMSPKEWLEGAKTAVAFFFPFTEGIRKRHLAGTGLTDEAWDTGYGSNFGIVDEFLDALTARLESEGVRVCHPNRDPRMTRNQIQTMSGGEPDLHFFTAWSNRHIIYAAGLGTFGIHRHIITEKGCCGTTAAFVMDLELEPTPRTYTEIYEYCTHCGACTKRCPANAITLEYYRNLLKCAGWSGHIRETLGKGFCGKCLVGIPCEAGIPGRGC